jgi:hypothetical protein
MGSFLDASWRIYTGQHPYRDFIYYTGPVHLYLNALFFHLFGFGKTAILAHLVFIHSTVIALVFLLARRHFPFFITLLITFLTAPSFYWSISHPWHDQTAHLWGIIGIILLAWYTPAASFRKIFWPMLVCGILANLAFITKTNIGTAYFFVFGIIAVTADNKKIRLCGYITGLILGGLVSLLIIRHPILFLQQLTAANQVMAVQRFEFLNNIGNLFHTFYWAAPVLISWAGFRQWPKIKMPFLLLLGTTSVAIFSLNTAGIIEDAYNFLWGIQIMSAFILLYCVSDEDKKSRLWKVTQTSLILLTLALIILSVKYGLELKTWSFQGKEITGDYLIKSESLKGWRCAFSQGFALDEMASAVNQHIPKDESLLILTDLYIINAITNRESYRGIPFGFMREFLPVPGKQTEEVKTHILENPPDWILTHRASFKGEIEMLELQEEIRDNYKLMKSSQGYILLKRR